MTTEEPEKGSEDGCHEKQDPFPPSFCSVEGRRRWDEGAAIWSGLIGVLGGGALYLLGAFAYRGYYWYLSIPPGAIDFQFHATLEKGFYLTIPIIPLVWLNLRAWMAGPNRFRYRIAGNSVLLLFLAAFFAFGYHFLPSHSAEVLGLGIVGCVAIFFAARLQDSSFLHDMENRGLPYGLLFSLWAIAALLLAAAGAGVIVAEDRISSARSGTETNQLTVEFVDEDHPLQNKNLALLATGKSTFFFFEPDAEQSGRPTTYAVPMSSVEAVIVNG